MLRSVLYRLRVLPLAVAGLASVPARAVTYEYDALGRR